MRKLVFTVVAILAALAAAPRHAAPSERAGFDRSSVSTGQFRPMHGQSPRILRTQPRAAAQCGLPDVKPWWIDFASGSVSFRYWIFGRPGIIAATEGGPTVPATLRRHNAKTVYWEMRLNAIVGTPTAPKDPDTIEPAARRLFAKAVAASVCEQPVIALNELFGSGTTTPWTKNNAQYRENVLILLRSLTAKGARPFLLLSTRPYTGGDAAAWWREAASVADIVPEVYFSGPAIYRQGPVGGPRTLRTAFRRAVRDLTDLGIPADRVGLVLGFQSRPGGREGLQPPTAWYRVVKWQALAAKQVAAELAIGSIWSWGWATFSSDRSGDEEKKVAACVYLWARDQGLCDGPAAAGPGFNAKLEEGPIVLADGVQCAVADQEIHDVSLQRLTAITGDREIAYTALLQRLVEHQHAEVTPEEVAAGEAAVIAVSFKGSRAAYLAALARARVTREVAVAVIADEIHRQKIEATFRVDPPSNAAAEAFYRSYPNIPARLLRASQRPWWLGGRASGLAIGFAAPSHVFVLPRDRDTLLVTSSGTHIVRPLTDTLPLGAFPLSLARPALRVALEAYARDDAFESWTLKEQTYALSRMVCRRDDLPEVGAVELSAFLPFVGLSY